MVIFINIGANHVAAQSDTTVIFNRHGREARFKFQIMETGKTSPTLSTTFQEWQRLMLLINNFVALEQEYDSLNSSRSTSDSLSVILSKHYQDALSLFNERIENYAATNNELIAVNQKLNDSLKNCTDLASHQLRRNTRRTVSIAGISASLGIILGTLILR